MQYFILYACCIPVRGHVRSVICDLQRKSFSYIPNALFYILENFAGRSIEQIKDEFTMEEQSIVTEYFEFLRKLDFGFISDRPLPNFQKIDLAYQSPELVTNVILDIDRSSTHCYSAIATQLDKVRCKFIQIRCFEEIEADRIDTILSAFRTSCLRSIYLVLCDADYITKEYLQTLVQEHLRLVHIILHSSTKTDLKLDDKNGRLTKVNVVPYPIASSDCCGEVSPSQFAINLQAFSEAMHFNSCLYKKIGIDVRGNIKNCPSFKQSFGDLSNTSIKEVIENPIFSERWGVTKDQVNICRDCEFRYICTDCRAFLQDPTDPRSKPLKCGYDPYTGKWGNWGEATLFEKGMTQVVEMAG